MTKNPTEIKELCHGESEDMQTKIKAAYWQGCLEGITFNNSVESKIKNREDNVVYLK